MFVDDSFTYTYVVTCIRIWFNTCCKHIMIYYEFLTWYPTLCNLNAISELHSIWLLHRISMCSLPDRPLRQQAWTVKTSPSHNLPSIIPQSRRPTYSSARIYIHTTGGETSDRIRFDSSMAIAQQATAEGTMKERNHGKSKVRKFSCSQARIHSSLEAFLFVFFFFSSLHVVVLCGATKVLD